MIQRRLREKQRPRATTVSEYFSAYKHIPGWLHKSDFLLFQKISEWHKTHDVVGDVLEIGAFRGRSAILLGYLIQENERFVVCDLFHPDFKSADLPAPPREVFERNYLQVHGELPTILQCSSSELSARLEAKTFRFIHVDGGHTYDVVRGDIATAETLLMAGGIVAFDDYLNRKFPGVAAAVWEAVATGGLVPVCLTNGKMYATWSPEPPLPRLVPELESWAQKHDFKTATHSLLGHDVLKVMVSPNGEGGSGKVRRAAELLLKKVSSS